MPTITTTLSYLNKLFKERYTSIFDTAFPSGWLFKGELPNTITLAKAKRVTLIKLK